MRRNVFAVIDDVPLANKLLAADRQFGVRRVTRAGAVGRFLELSVRTPDILDSLSYYKLLGFTELDDAQQKLVEEKRAEFEQANKQQDAFSETEYPEGAQLCNKCNTVAVIMMDGCMTCLSCGDSKCG